MPKPRYGLHVEELREHDGRSFLGYFSKGHHDPIAFLAAVAAFRAFVQGRFDTTSDRVRHEYWRNLPAPDGEGGCVFVKADKPGRGAYPVTVVEI